MTTIEQSSLAAGVHDDVAARSSDDGPESCRPIATLVEHARALDGLMERARTGAAVASVGDAIEAWRRLSTAVYAQIEAEETHVLPLFEVAHGAEAASLRDEHKAIRRALAAPFAVAEQRPLFTLAVGEACDRLRAHVAREAAVLYPWMERCLPLDVWNPIRKYFARV